MTSIITSAVDQLRELRQTGEQKSEYVVEIGKPLIDSKMIGRLGDEGKYILQDSSLSLSVETNVC